jgi:Carboxypeptidase regulatory-like domain
MLVRTLLLSSALFVCLTRSGYAQSPTDVIRGRVTNDSAKAVASATVFVTRGPDRAFKQTTTDADGKYTVVFENGTGDYLVAVSAVGLRSVRRRVQRQNSERELVADFALAVDVSTLAAVKVTAQKPARASNATSPYTPETGASERWSDGVNGQLSPSQMGNLAGIAGNTPGVTLGGNGPSILGSGAESNLTTLNGLAFSGGTLPRAARVDTRVTGATFDPVRGGFSGANIDVRLSAGDRNFQQRNAFLTLDAPALQATDVVGRALGARNESYRGSVGADGELIRQTLTYNVALDVTRESSNPATLLAGGRSALLAAGVSPDSAARLSALAAGFGIPFAGQGVPANRERTGVTWLGRLDDIRDSLNQRQITTFASASRHGAIGFGPLSAPSAGAERDERVLNGQFQMVNFLGDGRRVLNQTRLSATQIRSSSNPYLALPAATVLVRSATDSVAGITALSLGGNSSLLSRETSWNAEASNLTVWNVRGRTHTFKAFAWMRGDGLSQDGGADVLGRYTFNSIDDFAQRKPASFSRTLQQPTREGTVWNAAGAVAHQWSPTRYLSVLYGARIEGNGFASSPATNPALESALGVQTGRAPTTLHVSPRVGFSYSYSRSKNNGNGTARTSTGTFYRTATGVIRGGIGEFRDLLRPGLLADASSRTGLPGSTLVLACTGAAVPIPDWSQFVNGNESTPTQCTDGSGVLSDASPPATIIDAKYRVPRSWRASLDWVTNFDWLHVKWVNLASYDLSQPGTRDANFSGTQRFALAAEGNRPMYVSTNAIDAASGAVSAVESRRSNAFGRVGVRTSELRAYGGQSTITLSPDPFRIGRVRGSPYVSASYTLQSTRREFIGFDGAASGDPRLREWAPGPNDARHMMVLQAGVSPRMIGTITMFARVQSGLPFTPIVQGDINGDGRSGDRAFVPSSSDANTSAVLAAQLQSLLASGSSTARSCINAFAGRIASRNGCRGPATATLNMQFRPRLPKQFARVQAALFFENVLGGVDQALHGSRNLRGWGGAAYADPILLVPRGFDVANRAFRYDLNPRFAETRPSRTTLRNPFRVTLDFSFRLSTDYAVQSLRQALEPVRVARRWEPRSADSIAAFYVRRHSNLYTLILSQSDSLFLTTEQQANLKRAEGEFAVRVNATYAELAGYLAQFADRVPTKAAVDSATATEKIHWRHFWQQPEVAAAMLTPAQRELLSLLRDLLGVTPKNREGSQYYFGSNVKYAKPGTAPVELAAQPNR